jgi:hypothetical protein
MAEVDRFRQKGLRVWSTTLAGFLTSVMSVIAFIDDSYGLHTLPLASMFSALPALAVLVTVLWLRRA